MLNYSEGFPIGSEKPSAGLLQLNAYRPAQVLAAYDGDNLEFLDPARLTDPLSYVKGDIKKVETYNQFYALTQALGSLEGNLTGVSDGLLGIANDPTKGAAWRQLIGKAPLSPMRYGDSELTAEALDVDRKNLDMMLQAEQLQDLSGLSYDELTDRQKQIRDISTKLLYAEAQSKADEKLGFNWFDQFVAQDLFGITSSFSDTELAGDTKDIEKIMAREDPNFEPNNWFSSKFSNPIVNQYLLENGIDSSFVSDSPNADHAMIRIMHQLNVTDIQKRIGTYKPTTLDYVRLFRDGLVGGMINSPDTIPSIGAELALAGITTAIGSLVPGVGTAAGLAGGVMAAEATATALGGTSLFMRLKRVYDSASVAGKALKATAYTTETLYKLPLGIMPSYVSNFGLLRGAAAAFTFGAVQGGLAEYARQQREIAFGAATLYANPYALTDYNASLIATTALEEGLAFGGVFGLGGGLLRSGVGAVRNRVQGVEIDAGRGLRNSLDKRLTLEGTPLGNTIDNISGLMKKPEKPIIDAPVPEKLAKEAVIENTDITAEKMATETEARVDRVETREALNSPEVARSTPEDVGTRRYENETTAEYIARAAPNRVFRNIHEVMTEFARRTNNEGSERFIESGEVFDQMSVSDKMRVLFAGKKFLEDAKKVETEAVGLPKERERVYEELERQRKGEFFRLRKRLGSDRYKALKAELEGLKKRSQRNIPDLIKEARDTAKPAAERKVAAEEAAHKLLEAIESAATSPEREATVKAGIPTEASDVVDAAILEAKLTGEISETTENAVRDIAGAKERKETIFNALSMQIRNAINIAKVDKDRVAKIKYLNDNKADISNAFVSIVSGNKDSAKKFADYVDSLVTNSMLTSEDRILLFASVVHLNFSDVPFLEFGVEKMTTVKTDEVTGTKSIVSDSSTVAKWEFDKKKITLNANFGYFLSPKARSNQRIRSILHEIGHAYFKSRATGNIYLSNLKLYNKAVSSFGMALVQDKGFKSTLKLDDPMLNERFLSTYHLINAEEFFVQTFSKVLLTEAETIIQQMNPIDVSWTKSILLDIQKAVLVATRILNSSEFYDTASALVKEITNINKQMADQTLSVHELNEVFARSAQLTGGYTKFATNAREFATIIHKKGINDKYMLTRGEYEFLMNGQYFDPAMIAAMTIVKSQGLSAIDSGGRIGKHFNMFVEAYSEYKKTQTNSLLYKVMYFFESAKDYDKFINMTTEERLKYFKEQFFSISAERRNMGAIPATYEERSLKILDVFEQYAKKEKIPEGKYDYAYLVTTGKRLFEIASDPLFDKTVFGSKAKPVLDPKYDFVSFTNKDLMSVEDRANLLQTVSSNEYFNNSILDLVRDRLEKNGLTEMASVTGLLGRAAFILGFDDPSNKLFDISFNTTPQKELMLSTFYSSLVETIKTNPQRTMTKQQLAALLVKGSIKQEEIEWTGLKEYMDALPEDAKVDLNTLISIIKPVKIEEVIKGSETTIVHSTKNVSRVLVHDFIKTDTLPITDSVTSSGGKTYKTIVFPSSVIPVSKTLRDPLFFKKLGKYALEKQAEITDKDNWPLLIAAIKEFIAANIEKSEVFGGMEYVKLKDGNLINSSKDNIEFVTSKEQATTFYPEEIIPESRYGKVTAENVIKANESLLWGNNLPKERLMREEPELYPYFRNKELRAQVYNTVFNQVEEYLKTELDKLPENIQSAILDLFAPYRETIEKPLPGGHTIWDKYQRETLVLPNGEDQREFLIRFPDIELQSGMTHWEGGWNGNNTPVTNVVVHGRANTRYTPENFKVLFGEEFQSDWHQKGNERGYRPKDTPEKPEEFVNNEQRIKEVSERLGAIVPDIKKIMDNEVKLSNTELPDKLFSTKTQQLDKYNILVELSFNADEIKKAWKSKKPIDAYEFDITQPVYIVIRNKTFDLIDNNYTFSDYTAHILYDIADGSQEVGVGAIFPEGNFDLTGMTKAKDIVYSMGNNIINISQHPLFKYSSSFAYGYGSSSVDNIIAGMNLELKLIKEPKDLADALVLVKYFLKQQLMSKLPSDVLPNVKPYKQHIEELDFLFTYESTLARELADLTALNEGLNLIDPDLLPLAPFKSSEAWGGLIFKRMLKYAVEHGFDGVAWTTGQQQADRYNKIIIDNVSEISVTKTQSFASGFTDSYDITIDEKSGNKRNFDAISANELHNYVGKAKAKEITDSSRDNVFEPFVIKPSEEGGTMLFGATGYLEFYENIMVKVANKIGKKYKTSVKLQEVNGIGKQPYLPITDEMRMAILKDGLPLFNKLDGDNTPAEDIVRWQNKEDALANIVMLKDTKVDIGLLVKVAAANIDEAIVNKILTGSKSPEEFIGTLYDMINTDQVKQTKGSGKWVINKPTTKSKRKKAAESTSATKLKSEEKAASELSEVVTTDNLEEALIKVITLRPDLIDAYTVIQISEKRTASLELAVANGDIATINNLMAYLTTTDKNAAKDQQRKDQRAGRLNVDSDKGTSEKPIQTNRLTNLYEKKKLGKAELSDVYLQKALEWHEASNGSWLMPEAVALLKAKLALGTDSKVAAQSEKLFGKAIKRAAITARLNTLKLFITEEVAKHKLLESTLNEAGQKLRELDNDKKKAIEESRKNAEKANKEIKNTTRVPPVKKQRTIVEAGSRIRQTQALAESLKNKNPETLPTPTIPDTEASLFRATEETITGKKPEQTIRPAKQVDAILNGTNSGKKEAIGFTPKRPLKMDVESADILSADPVKLESVKKTASRIGSDALVFKDGSVIPLTTSDLPVLGATVIDAVPEQPKMLEIAKAADNTPVINVINRPRTDAPKQKKEGLPVTTKKIRVPRKPKSKTTTVPTGETRLPTIEKIVATVKEIPTDVVETTKAEKIERKFNEDIELLRVSGMDSGFLRKFLKKYWESKVEPDGSETVTPMFEMLWSHYVNVNQFIADANKRVLGEDILTKFWQAVDRLYVSDSLRVKVTEGPTGKKPLTYRQLLDKAAKEIQIEGKPEFVIPVLPEDIVFTKVDEAGNYRLNGKTKKVKSLIDEAGIDAKIPGPPSTDAVIKDIKEAEIPPEPTAPEPELPNEKVIENAINNVESGTSRLLRVNNLVGAIFGGNQRDSRTWWENLMNKSVNATQNGSRQGDTLRSVAPLLSFVSRFFDDRKTQTGHLVGAGKTAFKTAMQLRGEEGRLITRIFKEYAKINTIMPRMTNDQKAQLDIYTYETLFTNKQPNKADIVALGIPALYAEPITKQLSLLLKAARLANKNILDLETNTGRLLTVDADGNPISPDVFAPTQVDHEGLESIMRDRAARSNLLDKLVEVRTNRKLKDDKLDINTLIVLGWLDVEYNEKDQTLNIFAPDRTITYSEAANMFSLDTLQKLHESDITKSGISGKKSDILKLLRKSNPEKYFVLEFDDRYSVYRIPERVTDLAPHDKTKYMAAIQGDTAMYIEKWRKKLDGRNLVRVEMEEMLKFKTKSYPYNSTKDFNSIYNQPFFKLDPEGKTILPIKGLTPEEMFSTPETKAILRTNLAEAYFYFLKGRYFELAFQRELDRMLGKTGITILDVFNYVRKKTYDSFDNLSKDQNWSEAELRTAKNSLEEGLNRLYEEYQFNADTLPYLKSETGHSARIGLAAIRFKFSAGYGISAFTETMTELAKQSPELYTIPKNIIKAMRYVLADYRASKRKLLESDIGDMTFILESFRTDLANRYMGEIGYGAFKSDSRFGTRVNDTIINVKNGVGALEKGTRTLEEAGKWMQSIGSLQAITNGTRALAKQRIQRMIWRDISKGRVETLFDALTETTTASQLAELKKAAATDAKAEAKLWKEFAGIARHTAKFGDANEAALFLKYGLTTKEQIRHLKWAMEKANHRDGRVNILDLMDIHEDLRNNPVEGIDIDVMESAISSYAFMVEDLIIKTATSELGGLNKMTSLDSKSALGRMWYALTSWVQSYQDNVILDYGGRSTLKYLAGGIFLYAAMDTIVGLFKEWLAGRETEDIMEELDKQPSQYVLRGLTRVPFLGLYNGFLESGVSTVAGLTGGTYKYYGVPFLPAGAGAGMNTLESDFRSAQRLIEDPFSINAVKEASNLFGPTSLVNRSPVAIPVRVLEDAQVFKEMNAIQQYLDMVQREPYPYQKKAGTMFRPISLDVNEPAPRNYVMETAQAEKALSKQKTMGYDQRGVSEELGKLLE